MPLLNEKIKGLLERTRITLSFIQKVSEERQESIWYGGDVAILTHTPSGHTFTISAVGIVCVEYQPEDEVIFFKDKNNAGNFTKEFGDFIKTDKEFYELMDGKVTNTFFCLWDSNWWECESSNPIENFEEPIYLDASTFPEVLEETILLFIEYLEGVVPTNELERG